jgi:ketosteroid isomerase-like protein
MKTAATIVFVGLTALMLAACGESATNTSTNANTAKPTAAAPTPHALLAFEKQANEAYIKADSTFFEGMLSNKFIMHEGGQRMDKAAIVEMIGGVNCDIETWNLDEPQMAKIDADTYAFSYRGTWDGTCTGPDGKSMRIPSPTRAATVWVRSGDKWLAAFHGENLIIDPKNPPKAAPAPPAKQDDKAAADAELAAPAPDPSTDAMMAVEKSVWEAWMARDVKKLEDLTTKDLTFVNIFGTYFATKADTMKDWTEGECEINSVNVTDGAGTSLSPTVGILTVKGTADGTCYGQKLEGAVYGTSVYLKDGASWKLAFGFNSPD